MQAELVGQVESAEPQQGWQDSESHRKPKGQGLKLQECGHSCAPTLTFIRLFEQTEPSWQLELQPYETQPDRRGF